MAIETKPRESSDVETEQLATGCEAIAEAIRLADVDVMAAYPIRPYDGVMQAAAKLIANGKMDVEYIVADGEHSQFEIVKHACAVGARVFVGSSTVPAHSPHGHIDGIDVVRRGRVTLDVSDSPVRPNRGPSLLWNGLICLN